MNTGKLRLIACVFVVMALPHTASMADSKESPTPVADAQPEPEAQSFVSSHEIQIDGKRVAYTATAGTMIMRDEEEKAIAEFGYTSYVKKDARPASRPVMFAWNGGPGSASLWLHMGVLGPQLTMVKDIEVNGKGPFSRTENPYSIIDKADLVMVDPVGTGYSRAVGEAEGKDFWGVDNDIKSVSDFIVQYITSNGRWASPKYILGESYGGLRAGGVSLDLLTRHNMSLNGVVLVSPYMDVAGGGGVGVANMAVGYAMTLSGYAATAWYHDALNDKPADFLAFLAEVDAFAVDEYLPVLVKGARAPASERQAVAAKLGVYTGTSADYWLAANLRVTEGQFVAEVLRQRGQLAGRIDSRFASFTTNTLAEDMPFDPYMSAVGPAFAATFNDYYRRDLGVEMDRNYVVSGRLYRDWDRSHVQPGQEYPSPAADTGIDLAHAMIRNPDMKVLVQQGYFDLATPFRATEYFIDQMPLPEALRANVSIKYYEAGHMMYVHPPSLKQFRQDLAGFVD
ncbi:MAG: carboxypeptidase [Xanthomonadales bacterium]|nr:carboxypeptidase [Gammaproteobacteria bacterium]MBT8053930.1 carboxypeptidase [Gammaproteobacteria bacterium]NND58271.1 carboxypeptidase [Xanthomonadales bacterium]NNK52018.1 carboxypeptidase [Xanthomonadales bacterium]